MWENRRYEGTEAYICLYTVYIHMQQILLVSHTPYSINLSLSTLPTVRAMQDTCTSAVFTAQDTQVYRFTEVCASVWNATGVSSKLVQGRALCLPKVESPYVDTSIPIPYGGWPLRTYTSIWQLVVCDRGTCVCMSWWWRGVVVIRVEGLGRELY